MGQRKNSLNLGKLDESRFFKKQQTIPHAIPQEIEIPGIPT